MEGRKVQVLVRSMLYAGGIQRTRTNDVPVGVTRALTNPQLLAAEMAGPHTTGPKGRGCDPMHYVLQDISVMHLETSRDLAALLGREPKELLTLDEIGLP